MLINRSLRSSANFTQTDILLDDLQEVTEDLQHSIAPYRTQVLNTWKKYNWAGLENLSILYGVDIWDDGTNIYYSYSTNQYVLNTVTDTWEPKTWNGLTSFPGNCVWKVGNNIYFSNGGIQRVLDITTDTWETKTWNGYNVTGAYIWTDGVDIYYSNNANQYILDVSTDTWSQMTWNGLTNFRGSRVWSDGTNYYYSYNNDQYVLDIATHTWTVKVWNNMPTNLNGYWIWKGPNDDYYFSYGDEYEQVNTQYKLNISTSTWEQVAWQGLPYQPTLGSDIFKYKGEYYSFYKYITDGYNYKPSKLVMGDMAYQIQTSLTNCTIDNETSSVLQGDAFSANIIPDFGYNYGTVTITMGGTDITSTVYDNGVINIPHVLGNVVITVIAATTTTYTIDASSNSINGTITTSPVNIKGAVKITNTVNLNNPEVGTIYFNKVHRSASLDSIGDNICFTDTSVDGAQVLFNPGVAGGSWMAYLNGSYIYAFRNDFNKIEITLYEDITGTELETWLINNEGSAPDPFGPSLDF